MHDELEIKKVTNDNVVKFPVEEVEEADQTVENTEEKKKEPKKAIENPDDPLSDQSISNLTQMLKAAGDMVRLMEQNWLSTAKEFSITNSQMEQLGLYNENHRTPMPENLSDEEKDKWDQLNGIDNMTRAEAIEIFGEDSPILGVDDSQTRDRVKEAGQDFMSWLIARRQYRNLADSYNQLNELQEEQAINELRASALKETDPDAKKKKLESIDKYYAWKYLDFIAEPLSDIDKQRILKAFTTPDTCKYWINRAIDKLDHQLLTSSNFIREIAMFEQTQLEEKYWKCNNILLLYFLKLVDFNDMTKRPTKKDEITHDERTQAWCMIMGLDSVIRKLMSDDKRKRVLDNVRALEDQFIDIIPEKNINTMNMNPKEKASKVDDASEDNGSLADSNTESETDEE